MVGTFGEFGYALSMKNIDLPKINALIENFVQERDWDQFHSVKNLSMALSVECSELVEIFQWMDEAKSNQVRQDPAILPRVEDELADILFYLLRIASRTDIDLEAAIIGKIEKNEKKYPVQLVKGSSKKYDEY